MAGYYLPGEVPNLLGDRVYGCRFSDGTVKVGRSVDVKRRIREHDDAGAGFGIRAAAIWVSDDLAGRASGIESAILQNLSARFERRRNEYFTGLSLEDVAEAVEIAEPDLAPVTMEGDRCLADMLTAIAVVAAIENAGTTAKKLAGAAGIHYTSLYRKLRGDRGFTLEQITNIARALNVPARSLARFGDES